MHAAENNAVNIERLYREYGAVLVMFASAMTSDRSRAQDAVHQVFLKLMQDGALNRVADMKAYLFACTRNAVLNERKVRDRQTTPDADSAWFSPPDRDYKAEQSLRRGLAALPDDQRQTILMHVWGELTFAQIADVLGLSANTVASRYRYALAKLRELMASKENSSANR